jgi:hypothetical protein
MSISQAEISTLAVYQLAVTLCTSVHLKMLDTSAPTCSGVTEPNILLKKDILHGRLQHQQGLNHVSNAKHVKMSISCQYCRGNQSIRPECSADAVVTTSWCRGRRCARLRLQSAKLPHIFAGQSFAQSTSQCIVCAAAKRTARLQA